MVFPLRLVCCCRSNDVRRYCTVGTGINGMTPRPNPVLSYLAVENNAQGTGHGSIVPVVREAFGLLSSYRRRSKSHNEKVIHRFSQFQ
jgi:hypothetical protein